MNSRDAILAAIRKVNMPSGPPLPDLASPPTHPPDKPDLEWQTFPDRVAQFCAVVTAVGGLPIEAADIAAARAAIIALEPWTTAREIVCTVPGLEDLANVDPNTVDGPKALAGVDVAVLPGLFGVAENAAVWVDDHVLRQRAIYFLTQHLVLVVPRHELVDNLHQAYARLRFAEPRYGLFVSGPSKTADIEQSLVIGAHGPRSLTVVLLGTA